MDFNNIKFLSDYIYFDLRPHLTAEHTGKNIDYTIHVNTADSEPVYRGSVYITDIKNCKIYVNDIAAAQMDDFQWFRTQSTADVKPDILSLIIDIPSLNVTDELTVYNAYLRPIDFPAFPDDMQNYKELFNMRFYLGGGDPTSTPNYVKPNKWVAPVIPKFIKAPTGRSTKPFLMCQTHFIDNENTAKYVKYTVYIRLYTNTNPAEWRRYNLLSDVIVRDGNPVIHINVVIDPYRNNITNIFNNVTEYERAELWIEMKTEDGSEKDGHMLFKFSGHPRTIFSGPESEYYIAWINRFGFFQMQPLCKNWEMKEKTVTSNITTVNDETIPVQKANEFSWTLNTDWLDIKHHDEFESLLTSKYAYLYNTKTGQCDYVNVKDSEWTFRNNTNTKRPFNLTVNLVKAQKQNIIY
jgi:hypothetical protein